ncbi:hypothetical protein GBA52_022329 [Prunus armeniaca]|nr:hypothetical protein GBA52_022329 [Prunus armeniaca]
MSSKLTLPLILLSGFVFLAQLSFSTGQTVVKGAYWFPDSGFPASSINSSLFTHLFCAFADLNSANYQVTVSSSNSAPSQASHKLSKKTTLQ